VGWRCWNRNCCIGRVSSSCVIVRVATHKFFRIRRTKPTSDAVAVRFGGKTEDRFVIGDDVAATFFQELAMPKVSKGDKVQWETSQGRTEGEVTRKVTGPTKAGGYVAKASPRNPQYEVKSSKSGKTAIHKASALKKVR